MSAFSKQARPTICLLLNGVCTRLIQSFVLRVHIVLHLPRSLSRPKQYVGEAGPDYPGGQRYCSTLLVKPNKVTDNIRYSSCCGYDHKKKLRASLICECGRCFCVSCITPLLDSSSGALAPSKWSLSSVSKFFQYAGAIFECPECATCLQCLKPYALEAEDAPSPSQCVQCLEWRCHTCKRSRPRIVPKLSTALTNPQEPTRKNNNKNYSIHNTGDDDDVFSCSFFFFFLSSPFLHLIYSVRGAYI